jgi:DNA-binding NtrC family response regulator
MTIDPGQHSKPSVAPEGPADLLLIEDTMSMARVYLEYLRRGPYGVRHSITGRDAIMEIDRRPPEAVLLDLRLPDMDGLDVLRHIKAQNYDCAVVVITADGSLNRAVEAMRDGALDFLVKPFNADRLLITLRNVLERKRLTSMVESLAGDTLQGQAPSANSVGDVATNLGIRPLTQVEREAIERAIEICGGNIVRAAAMLEVSPSTIYRKRVAWEALSEPSRAPLKRHG